MTRNRVSDERTEGALTTMYFDWKGTSICKFKTSKQHSKEEYETKANEIILQGLRMGYNLDGVKLFMMTCMDDIEYKRRVKGKLDTESCMIACFTILALLKLKAVNEYDVLIELVNQKKRKKSLAS